MQNKQTGQEDNSRGKIKIFIREMVLNINEIRKNTSIAPEKGSVMSYKCYEI